MTRTITALFDSRADAQDAVDRLKASGLDADHVRIHDKSSAGKGGYSTHSEPGFWASIKNVFLPDEDRHMYEEGVHRGGFLVTADVDEDEAGQALTLLEQTSPVDIDQRAQEWRSQGWAYPAGSAQSQMGQGQMGRTQMGDAQTSAEAIPVVEEQLVVGKREVNRGGVRVRSYVTETPVHEQIRLRDERINVERRAVDLPVDAGSDAFRERTIEVTAMGEEAVVGKTARIVEEVRVSKTAEEHVEEVADTVRRTDVEVERDMDQGGASRGTRGR